MVLDYLENAYWYHSIRFSKNLKSRGVYDHEKCLEKYGFPETLKGKSVLDVGCSDGFFSFEFEKREASRVLAIDINKYDGSLPGTTSVTKKQIFEEKYQKQYLKNQKFINLAKELGLENVHHVKICKILLNSNIEYKDWSIYDLEKLNEKFDFVFCGDLIGHLKNPILAIEQLRKVCKDFCIIAEFNPMNLPWILKWLNYLSRFKNKLLTYSGGSGFFNFHPGTFKRLLYDCGFTQVKVHSTFDLWQGRDKYYIPHIVYHCYV